MSGHRTQLDERRKAAKNRLVVLDIESIGHMWSDIVEPKDLVGRSVLIRSLLAARREGDTFLVGCDPSFGWAVSEVFPGAVLFLSSGELGERRPITTEFIQHYRTGRYGEVCVVTGDESLVQIAQVVVGAEDPLRLVATRQECAELFATATGNVVVRPDFVVGEAAG